MPRRHLPFHTSALVVLTTLGLLAGCSDPSDAPPGQPLPAELFGGSYSAVRIEVDYMPQAEPYTDSAEGTGDLWQFFGRNAQRMFSTTGMTVEHPATLAQMEPIPAGDGEYSISEILDLASMHRDDPGDEETATFYFVWLDGVLFDQGQRQEAVLGLNIGDTGVLAMFKPVIAAQEVALPIAWFVEQTTLVHEFGHGVGLVDRGIPLTSDHHDPSHAAHCSNPECVMYWATARVADAVEFVRRYQETQDPVVFGPECLLDLDTAAMP